MFDKAFGKKKAYSAAIDLTQDEETEGDEGQRPMPPLTKRKMDEKLNSELQSIHQALVKIQARWCTLEGISLVCDI